MEDEIVGVGDESFHAILVRRELYDKERNPHLKLRDQTILKNGPRCYRVAKHHAVVNNETGEVIHHSVTIDTYEHTKSNWMFQRPRQLTITDKDSDEIGRLQVFLSAIRQGIPEEDGRYLVIRLDDQLSPRIVHDLLSSVSTNYSAELLMQALAIADGDPVTLKLLAEAAKERPSASRAAVAALNVARFSTALETLRTLVEENAKESAFQQHLSENMWIFGSEYSALLDLRRATRDEQQDFIVRRTIDDYIEVIEIKTPLEGKPLFIYDASHDSLYPSQALSKVVGQVIKYIEKLDANRQMLFMENGLDTNKIRVKVIIGRDGDETQRAALRNLNGHLHRVEVITFDQLLRVGERVLGHLQSIIEAPTSQPTDFSLGDIPF